ATTAATRRRCCRTSCPSRSPSSRTRSTSARCWPPRSTTPRWAPASSRRPTSGSRPCRSGSTPSVPPPRPSSKSTATSSATSTAWRWKAPTPFPASAPSPTGSARQRTGRAPPVGLGPAGPRMGGPLSLPLLRAVLGGVGLPPGGAPARLRDAVEPAGPLDLAARAVDDRGGQQRRGRAQADPPRVLQPVGRGAGAELRPARGRQQGGRGALEPPVPFGSEEPFEAPHAHQGPRPARQVEQAVAQGEYRGIAHDRPLRVRHLLLPSTL